MPSASSRVANDSTLSGAIVGQRTTQVPRAAPATTPSLPKSTASVCAASTTATMTTSHCRDSIAGVATARAPSRPASTSRSARTSRTKTLRPCPARRPAIAAPMLPTPITPMLSRSTRDCDDAGGRSAKGCAQTPAPQGGGQGMMAVAGRESRVDTEGEDDG
jgi:hypothetical protein